jgi:hypothetical protein
MSESGETARAEVIVTKNGDVWHLYARSTGESNKQALDAVRIIYEAFTKSFETWVRAMPEVSSDRDFNTQIMRHAGFVRFSFIKREGPIHPPEPSAGTTFAAIPSAVVP